MGSPQLTLSQNKSQAALARLIINNPELEKLESTLSEFNLFEAIGVIRQELKHSNMLAFYWLHLPVTDSMIDFLKAINQRIHPVQNRPRLLQ